MRRRLVLLTAATTSMVAIAFVVPLMLLVRSLAEERAFRPAELAAQGIAPVVGTLDPVAIGDAVDAAAVRLRTAVAVTMPDGSVIGADSARHDGEIPTSLSILDREGVADARVVLPVLLAQGTAVVVAEVTESAVQRGVAEASLALFALGIVLVGGAVGVADLFARRTLDVVDELEAVALLLSDGQLDSRVADDDTSPAELARVGAALNTLASRIGVLLAHEREVAADLSHRLRTPMTAMRLQVDNLGDGPQRDDLRIALDQLQAGVDRVIQDARRPVREGALPRCELGAAVAERVGFWMALADDEERMLTFTPPTTDAWVALAPADVADVMDLLLGNVFTHTPPGTAASVAITTRGTDWLLSVSDEGAGFPDGVEVVARGVSGGTGSGLGLDIASQTAQRAGGRLELGTGPGATVSLVLPPVEGPR